MNTLLEISFFLIWATSFILFLFLIISIIRYLWNKGSK